MEGENREMDFYNLLTKFKGFIMQEEIIKSMMAGKLSGLNYWRSSPAQLMKSLKRKVIKSKKTS